MDGRTDADDAMPHALDRGMHVAETALYAVVGALLVACAAIALVTVGYHLFDDLDGGALESVAAALDGLLLVFIFVELLGAVRATVSERKLLAEPFLIVGIIASIKEIVVASLKAADASGEAFDEVVLEIGVLAGVVLLLAVSSYLVRRKEREPTEE